KILQEKPKNTEIIEKEKSRDFRTKGKSRIRENKKGQVYNTNKLGIKKQGYKAIVDPYSNKYIRDESEGEKGESPDPELIGTTITFLMGNFKNKIYEEILRASRAQECPTRS
ncbi:14406_t:CDS:2, partial [Gigaspora rosea]